jgi:hypothetical protein
MVGDLSCKLKIFALFSVPQGKFQDNFLNQATSASFQILSYSLTTDHPIVRYHIAETTESIVKLKKQKQKQTSKSISVVLVRKRTIPTERSPLVGEV